MIKGKKKGRKRKNEPLLTPNAQVVNLNKQAFEADPESSRGLLEDAMNIDQTVVNVTLQIYTTINLAGAYIKTGEDLKALALLTDKQNYLNSQKEFIYEKSLILLAIANVKSILKENIESIRDLIVCIELLKLIKTRDLNYFNIITTAYYNIYVESQKLGNLVESFRYLNIAKKIAANRLGLGNTFSRFLNKIAVPVALEYIEHPLQIPNRSTTQDFRRTRASSSLKTKLTRAKIYKKFHKISQSSDFSSSPLKKVFDSYSSPLSALIEEDESDSSHYPKFGLTKAVRLPLIKTTDHKKQQKKGRTQNFVIDNELKKIILLEEELIKSKVGKREKRRKRIKEDIESQVKGIIKIQSWWRGVRVRREVTRKSRAVVVIQKNCRRYFTQKVYLKIKAAILFIQEHYRAYKKKIIV